MLLYQRLYKGLFFLSVQKYYKKTKYSYKKIPSYRGSIQLNACSNLACSNYGIEATNPLISDHPNKDPYLNIG